MPKGSRTSVRTSKVKRYSFKTMKKHERLSARFARKIGKKPEVASALTVQPNNAGNLWKPSNSKKYNKINVKSKSHNPMGTLKFTRSKDEYLEVLSMNPKKPK